MCGNPGYRYPNKRNGVAPLYCSSRCQGIAHRKRILEATCEHCGAMFNQTVNEKYGTTSLRKFCNSECRTKYALAKRTERLRAFCSSCDTELPTFTRSGNFVTNRKTSLCVDCRKKRKIRVRSGRSKQNEGYVLLSKHSLTDEELRLANAMVGSKFVLEHRLLMAVHLGRPLLHTEVVHHINGVKDDNRLENLSLEENSLHSKKHKDAAREILKLRERVTFLEGLLQRQLYGWNEPSADDKEPSLVSGFTLAAPKASEARKKTENYYERVSEKLHGETGEVGR